jgi:predicted methyltransferase
VNGAQILNICAISYAVMYLMLGCGLVGIFLITHDYRDHALTKWNQFQECMITATWLMRTENIRKLVFSDLPVLKINAS